MSSNKAIIAFLEKSLRELKVEKKTTKKTTKKTKKLGKIEDCSTKTELKKFSKDDLKKFLIKKKVKSLSTKNKEELVVLAMKYLKGDSSSDSDSDSESDSESDSDDSESDSESDSDSD
jgi:hypothetical protein